MNLLSFPQTTYQWHEKQPNVLNNKISHSRLVYIGLPSPSLPRWVAKIETPEIRNRRGQLFFPYAEEVAYKVCKLFHWDTIPKSKVLHQCDLQNLGCVEKINKYEPLIKSFEKIYGPKTFTFQLFVDGETLDNTTPQTTQMPDLSSFQKAYLLSMILGKYDDRGDNTIFDCKTRKLFGIDNEYIGLTEYRTTGILNCFKDLKKKEIDSHILADILKVTDVDLKHIQDKYHAKELKLIGLWFNEIIYEPLNKSASIDIQSSNLRYSSESSSLGVAESDDEEFAINDCWAAILNNFKFLKEEILCLKGRHEPITIKLLEKGVAAAHKKLSSSLDSNELQF